MMSAHAETRSRPPRRRFTDEFKQQAVRLVLDEDKSVTAVARELDLVASALGNWVKQAQADRSKGAEWPDVRRTVGTRVASQRKSDRPPEMGGNFRVIHALRL
jgi:transposase-like protein